MRWVIGESWDAVERVPTRFSCGISTGAPASGVRASDVIQTILFIRSTDLPKVLTIVHLRGLAPSEAGAAAASSNLRV